MLAFEQSISDHTYQLSGAASQMSLKTTPIALFLSCERVEQRVEPRGYFISSLNMIIQMRVVQNRTVVDGDLHFDNVFLSCLTM